MDTAIDTPDKPGVRAAHRAVAGIFFFSGSLFGVLASRIPAIKTANGLSEAMLGVALLAFAFGGLVSFPIAGVLAGRVGAARLARAAVAAVPPALMAVGLTNDIWLLAPALFVYGFCFGAQDVAMNTWGAEVEQAAGRSIMSGLHGMFSLGAGLGAASGVVAVTLGAAPFGHFLVFGMVLALAAWRNGRAPWVSTTISAADRTTRRIVVPRGDLLLAGTLVLIAFMSEGAAADWSALYLVDRLGASESAAPIGFVVFSIAIVIGRFSGDPLIGKFGPVAIARVAGLLSVAGGAIVVAATVPWAAWVGFGVMGLGLSTVAPIAFSRAAVDPHVAPGPAIASVATLGYGGLLLGPPLMGFVAEVASLQFSFALITAAMALIVVFARATAR